MNRAGFNVSAAGLLADDFSGIGKHMRALGLSRVGQETLESAAQAVTRGRGKPAVGAMKGERATALRKVLNELGVPIQSDAALKKLIERHAKVDAEDWRLGGIAAGIRPPK
ncbi:MAG: hypothetical protein ABI548_04600 [Polyangiaceae bacterium]